jgi:hypothetical protein
MIQTTQRNFGVSSGAINWTQILTYLIIEGDSKRSILLVAKIINKTDLEKNSPSWHRLGPLSYLQDFLRPSLTLITSHIRREAPDGVTPVDHLIHGTLATSAVKAPRRQPPPLSFHYA